MLTNKIISQELGHESVINYLKTQGWLMTKGKNGQLNLSYSKLQVAYNAKGCFAINLFVLIENIYKKFLNSDEFKQIYSGKAAIQVLKMSSSSLQMPPTTKPILNTGS